MVENPSMDTDNICLKSGSFKALPNTPDRNKPARETKQCQTSNEKKNT